MDLLIALASKQERTRRALVRLSSERRSSREQGVRERSEDEDGEHNKAETTVPGPSAPASLTSAVSSCKADSAMDIDTFDFSLFDDDPFSPLVDDDRVADDGNRPNEFPIQVELETTKALMKTPRVEPGLEPSSDDTVKRETHLNTKSDEVSPTCNVHVVPVCLSSCHLRLDSAVMKMSQESVVPIGFQLNDVKDNDNAVFGIFSSSVVCESAQKKMRTEHDVTCVTPRRKRALLKQRAMACHDEEVACLLDDLVESASTKEFDEGAAAGHSEPQDHSCRAPSSASTALAMATQNLQDDDYIIDLIASRDSRCNDVTKKRPVSSEAKTAKEFSERFVIVLSDSDEDVEVDYRSVQLEPSVPGGPNRRQNLNPPIASSANFSKEEKVCPLGAQVAVPLKTNTTSMSTSMTTSTTMSMTTSGTTSSCKLKLDEVEELNRIFAEDFYEAEHVSEVLSSSSSFKKETHSDEDDDILDALYDDSICKHHGDKPNDTVPLISTSGNFKRPQKKKMMKKNASSAIKFDARTDPLARFLFVRLNRIDQAPDGISSTKETSLLEQLQTKPVFKEEVSLNSGYATKITHDFFKTFPNSRCPTEASLSSARPTLFRIICSAPLTQNHELMKLMENSHNITFVERNYDAAMGSIVKCGRVFSDIDVDERTAIILRPLAALADETKAKELGDDLVRFGLKYAKCYVVLHGGNSSPLSQEEFKKLTQNLSKLYFTASYFSSKKHDYEIKVRFAFGERQLAETIRVVCDLALSATTVWDAEKWHSRTWLLDGMSAHERFLLCFPSINSFSAQVMLSAKSLLELLSLPLKELINTVPWVPERFLKAFHDTAHVELGLLSPWSVPIGIKPAETLPEEEFPHQFDDVRHLPLFEDVDAAPSQMMSCEWESSCSPFDLDSCPGQSAPSRNKFPSAAAAALAAPPWSSSSEFSCESGFEPNFVPPPFQAISQRDCGYVAPERIQASNNRLEMSSRNPRPDRASDRHPEEAKSTPAFCQEYEPIDDESPPMNLPSFTTCRKFDGSTVASTSDSNRSRFEPLGFARGHQLVTRGQQDKCISEQWIKPIGLKTGKQPTLRFQKVPGNMGQTRLIFG